MAVGSMEHLEGKTSLGAVKEVLTQKGLDMIISEKFYCTVFQAVLLFGDETWVLMEEMTKNLKGAHIVFLRR